MLSCKTLFHNKLDINRTRFSHIKFHSFRQKSNNKPKIDRIHTNIINSTKKDKNEKNCLSKTNTAFSSLRQHFSFPTKTTNSSSLENSLNLYKIRRPHEVIFSIKDKIKNIKKRRKILIENYYTESLKTSSAFKNSNVHSKNNIGFLSPHFRNEITNKNIKTTYHIISNSDNLIPEQKKNNLNMYSYKKAHTKNSNIHHFVDEVKYMIKGKFMQKYLKNKELNCIFVKHANEDNLKIEIKSKSDNHKLFDQFYSEYERYHRKLQIETNKDVNYSNLLNWYIISLKNDIQSLLHKKEKLTNRLNKYIEVKEFINKMKEYCLEKEIKDSMFDKFKIICVEPKKLKKSNSKENIKKIEQNINEFSLEQILSKSPEQKSRRFSSIENSGNNHKKLRSRRYSQLITKNELKEIDDLCPRSNKITSVLNKHIAELLIRQNMLSEDIKPLKNEYDYMYKKLQKSKEGLEKTEEIQTLNNKLRKEKEKNLILQNDLENIKKNNKNIKCKNRFYIKIEKKLLEIYNFLIDNKINNEVEYRKQKHITIMGNILYYLKNVELGLNVLMKEKANLKKYRPALYETLIFKINELKKEKLKKLTIEKQFNYERKKISDIINKMQKTVYKNTRTDYSRYVKRSKTKEKKVIVNPELNLLQEYKYFIGYHDDMM